MCDCIKLFEFWKMVLNVFVDNL